MQEQERRAAGVDRVAVERVVEICGREPGIPAFEAESVELSGRGMHVRTPYLPELEAPLVCRLEDDGREIVVEGVVAWRNQTESGGEFGIRFTALDSSSVGVLKALCGMDDPEDAEPASAASVEPPAAEEPSPAPPLATPGHAVKLHIDGLGSPMKARVRRGSKRRVHVGSNLEFLRVGRNLEIEDLDGAARMAAMIDAVTVAVDPQTDVPQLVVTLRYEGVEDVTPSPSVVDASVAQLPAKPATARPEVVMAPSTRSPMSALDDDMDGEAVDGEEDDDIDRFVQQSALKEQLEGLASKAGQAARMTTSLLAKVGARTASGMGVLAERAGRKVAEVRESRSKRSPRRTSAPARAASLGAAPRLRPQSGAKRLEDQPGPDPNAKKKRIALASAGAGVLLAGAVMMFGGKSDEQAESVAALAAVEEASPSAAPEIIEPPAMKVSAAAEPAAKGPPKNEHGIVADVPLFGPTPMATMEPAPLEPPDDDIEAAAESDVADETFDAPTASGDKGADARPAAWGNGRLHLPFVHRIKLDEPGAAIEGAKRSTGFTVFIPKRKLLETGKAISRRDDRILEVRTSNEPRGARVTFVFQGQVPAYKARLKGDQVEFFISSPKGR